MPSIMVLSNHEIDYFKIKSQNLADEGTLNIALIESLWEILLLIASAGN